MLILYRLEKKSQLMHFFMPFLAIFSFHYFCACWITQRAALIGGWNSCFLGIMILIFLILFRLDSFRISKKYGKRFFHFIYVILFFVTSLYFDFFRFSFFKKFVFDCLFWGGLGVIGLPLPSSEAGRIEGSSRGSGWTTHDLDVLAEPFSETEMEGTSGGTDTTSISVNKPEGEPPFPRTNARGDPAGPSKVCPFPFQDDEIIGGDCLNNVYRRLLEALQAKKGEDLSLADYALTRYKAEDLFEVKVSIIRQMAPLDPEGDWDRRGAQALENPRTTTGEEPLERRGVQSEAFRLLKQRVLGRRFEDSDSEA